MAHYGPYYESAEDFSQLEKPKEERVSQAVKVAENKRKERINCPRLCRNRGESTQIILSLQKVKKKREADVKTTFSSVLRELKVMSMELIHLNLFELGINGVEMDFGRILKELI